MAGVVAGASSGWDGTEIRLPAVRILPLVRQGENPDGGQADFRSVPSRGSSAAGIAAGQEEGR